MFQSIPFQSLTDLQWDALRPHLAHAAPQGRPVADLRHRMEGMFHLIATDAPWREVPPEYGAAGTVARHFRRLSQAGLWERLLQALHAVGPDHPLQTLRPMIFRAARRAYRIRGLKLIVLARRLGFLGALPGPSSMVADPDLSETLVALQLRQGDNLCRFVMRWGKSLRNLMRLAGGRPNMPRSVRLAMP